MLENVCVVNRYCKLEKKLKKEKSKTCYKKWSADSLLFDDVYIIIIIIIIIIIGVYIT